MPRTWFAKGLNILRLSSSDNQGLESSVGMDRRMAQQSLVMIPLLIPARLCSRENCGCLGRKQFNLTRKESFAGCMSDSINPTLTNGISESTVAE